MARSRRTAQQVQQLAPQQVQQLAPQQLGYVAVPPLTLADIEFLKSRSALFVHHLANSHLMNGFTYDQDNKHLVAQLTASALLGTWGGPEFTQAYNLVVNNMATAAWSPKPPQQPGDGVPLPPP